MNSQVINTLPRPARHLLCACLMLAIASGTLTGQQVSPSDESASARLPSVGYQPPKAPATGILDAAALFDEPRRSSIEKVMDRLRKTHRVTLYLATFESLSERELPADRARVLSKAWLKDDQLGAVLVYIVNEERFALASTSALDILDRDNVLNALPKQYEQLAGIRTSAAIATREALYNLDFNIRKILDDDAQRKRVLLPLVYFGAAVGTTIVLALIVALFREIALHNFFGRKLLFPSIKKPERLGARNSGGHSATLNYGSHQSSLPSAKGKRKQEEPTDAPAAVPMEHSPSSEKSPT